MNFGSVIIPSILEKLLRRFPAIIFFSFILLWFLPTHAQAYEDNTTFNVSGQELKSAIGDPTMDSETGSEQGCKLQAPICDGFNSESQSNWIINTPISENNVKFGVQEDSARVLALSFPGGMSQNFNGTKYATSVETKDNCNYGTYKAKFNAASCEDGEGIVSGFFTYWNGIDPITGRPKDDWDNNKNNIADNSEIDFEILGHCPSYVYMTIWTDYQRKDKNSYKKEEFEFRKITRVINLEEGEIWQTPLGKDNTRDLDPLSDLPSDLKKIPKIDNFDASKDFYEYGFSWDQDYVRFFIIDKEDNKIELWNYNSSEHIPTHPGKLVFNVWHTNDWQCVDNGEYRLDQPSSDATLFIDKVKYSPKSWFSAIPPREDWTQTFAGPGYPDSFGISGNDNGYSIQQTKDGGYIIAGYTENNGPNIGDAWIIKINSIGKTEWSKTFGGTPRFQNTGYIGGDDSSYFVDQTIDGGYIIAGTTRSAPRYYNASRPYGRGTSYLWLIRLDSSGRELWNRTFGELENNAAYAVRQTKDGGYIATGTETIKTDSEGNVEWNISIDGRSVQQTMGDGYIIIGKQLTKIYANGTTEWSKPIPGYSIQQTNDGGYIIVSSKRFHGLGTFNDDILLVKVDATGEEEWSETFGDPNPDIGRSVQQTKDGGYVIAGSTIIKTDNCGNELWNLTLSEPGNDEAYSSGSRNANSIQQTEDDGYIVVGEIAKYEPGSPQAMLQDQKDIWITKLKPESKPEISGHVYDFDNSEPISNAKISLEKCQVYTDMTGSYNLVNHPPSCIIHPVASYLINCSASGYEMTSMRASTGKDGSALIDFYLKKAHFMRIEFINIGRDGVVTENSHKIIIKIINESGVPIPGVKIHINNIKNPQRYSTIPGCPIEIKEKGEKYIIAYNNLHSNIALREDYNFTFEKSSYPIVTLIKELVFVPSVLMSNDSGGDKDVIENNDGIINPKAIPKSTEIYLTEAKRVLADGQKYLLLDTSYYKDNIRGYGFLAIDQNGNLVTDEGIFNKIVFTGFYGSELRFSKFNIYGGLLIQAADAQVLGEVILKLRDISSKVLGRILASQVLPYSGFTEIMKNQDNARIYANSIRNLVDACKEVQNFRELLDESIIRQAATIDIYRIGYSFNNLSNYINSTMLNGDYDDKEVLNAWEEWKRLEAGMDRDLILIKQLNPPADLIGQLKDVATSSIEGAIGIDNIESLGEREKIILEITWQSHHEYLVTQQKFEDRKKELEEKASLGLAVIEGTGQNKILNSVH
jgi:hypothetical protein